MKSKTYWLIGSVLLIIIGNLILLPSASSIQSNFFLPDQSEHMKLSSSSNNDLLNSIVDNKIQDYSDLAYFPQIYESSLQATYYGLFIFDSIGKLDNINKTAIRDYIMSYYNPSTNRFMDTLAYRYLDSDFSFKLVPLSSVLEVNCYAVLALDILESLHLIDIPEMISFIWSCHNNISSGFIGRTYEPSLDDEFKISTADNTFFAVSTLDLLMDDWLGYSTEKQAIIQFLNNLQDSSGGFNNADDLEFVSMNPLLEPNLLTSYYCIKALEVFGVEGSIDVSNFHQYLTDLYDSNYDYFRMSIWDYNLNYTNIVGTALGLELSDISLYTGIDRNEVINFIVGNRNSLGNWDQSTTVGIHELIDTYQILRSLNNSGILTQLTLEERNEIGNATLMYYNDNGFSLLSVDYTSMKLVNTVVSAFTQYDRISDLEIHQLYTRIKDSYVDYADFGISRFFYGYLLSNTHLYWFRSHPIEYYSMGHKFYLDEITQLNSHESTYYALNSLKNMFKLDDLAASFNLNNLLSDIVDTQFLNDSYYQNYGAFSSLVKFDSARSEFINILIHIEYSYYAIRCLEILTEQLSLNFTNIGFDMNALYTYIDRNVIETPSTLYFTPRPTSSIETILQNTYYMIYILKALDLFDKDTGKIENYLIQNLDYTNIKNVYYCYKISEILELDIEFNSILIQNLVNTLYSEEYEEFYMAIDRKNIEQEAFLWICEMARNSPIEIEASYSSTVELGGINSMEVSLQNLVLRDFGAYITFKFESDQIGTFTFSKVGDNTYVRDIPIPLDFQYCPIIEGKLCAYEGVQKKAELDIQFHTTYSIIHNLYINNTDSPIDLRVNISLLANNTKFPLSSGNVFTKIYKDALMFDEIDFSKVEFNYSSVFTLTYSPPEEGEYFFEIFLYDQIRDLTSMIGNSSFTNIGEVDQKPNPQNYDNEITSAIPLMVVFIGVPGIVIGISTHQLKKDKKGLN